MGGPVVQFYPGAGSPASPAQLLLKKGPWESLFLGGGGGVVVAGMIIRFGLNLLDYQVKAQNATLSI